jgi:hypothetical protein
MIDDSPVSHLKQPPQIEEKSSMKPTPISGTSNQLSSPGANQAIIPGPVLQNSES